VIKESEKRNTKTVIGAVGGCGGLKEL